MNISRLTGRKCRAVLSAFTLVEVMVAVLIVSIAVVSLYTGVSSGFALVKLAREDLRATQIMLQRMENLRLYTWSQITNQSYFPTSTYTDYYDPSGQPNGSGGVVYTVNTAITPNPTFTPSASYSPAMLRVIIQVSWASGSVQRRREMSTYVARYGMQNYIYSTTNAPPL